VVVRVVTGSGFWKSQGWCRHSGVEVFQNWGFGKVGIGVEVGVGFQGSGFFGVGVRAEVGMKVEVGVAVGVAENFLKDES
jgi:hypothetical protein